MGRSKRNQTKHDAKVRSIANELVKKGFDLRALCFGKEVEESNFKV